jgi:hypothetical protein
MFYRFNSRIIACIKQYKIYLSKLTGEYKKSLELPPTNFANVGPYKKLNLASLVSCWIPP